MTSFIWVGISDDVSSSCCCTYFNVEVHVFDNFVLNFKLNQFSHIQVSVLQFRPKYALVNTELYV